MKLEADYPPYDMQLRDLEVEYYHQTVVNNALGLAVSMRTWEHDGIVPVPHGPMNGVQKRVNSALAPLTQYDPD